MTSTSSAAAPQPLQSLPQGRAQYAVTENRTCSAGVRIFTPAGTCRSFTLRSHRWWRGCSGPRRGVPECRPGSIRFPQSRSGAPAPYRYPPAQGAVPVGDGHRRRTNWFMATVEVNVLHIVLGRVALNLAPARGAMGWPDSSSFDEAAAGWWACRTLRSVEMACGSVFLPYTTAGRASLHAARGWHGDRSCGSAFRTSFSMVLFSPCCCQPWLAQAAYAGSEPKRWSPVIVHIELQAIARQMPGR